MHEVRCLGGCFRNSAKLTCAGNKEWELFITANVATPRRCFELRLLKIGGARVELS
jgi:hypothetical protein